MVPDVPRTGATSHHNNNEDSHEPEPRHFPLRLALTLLGCTACLPALATEAGVDNIGPGTDGFFMLPLEVDSLPENMVAFNLYYNHYKSTKLNISSLGGKVPNVDIESTAVIPRIDYLSPVRVFGGRLAGYIAQPWLKQEVSVFGLSDPRRHGRHHDCTDHPVGHGQEPDPRRRPGNHRAHR
jgi:hypothetical protein